MITQTAYRLLPEVDVFAITINQFLFLYGGWEPFESHSPKLEQT